MYRYERSGTMHGLFRVRGFTQVRVESKGGSAVGLAAAPLTVNVLQHAPGGACRADCKQAAE